MGSGMRWQVIKPQWSEYCLLILEVQGPVRFMAMTRVIFLFVLAHFTCKFFYLVLKYTFFMYTFVAMLGYL